MFFGGFKLHRLISRCGFWIVKKFIKDNKQKLKYLFDENAFSRNCEMLFEDYIYYMLNNKGLTTTLELDNYFEEMKGMDVLPISRQDYSKQRQKFSGDYFKEMNRQIIKTQHELNNDVFDKFKDYNVWAIDGSQVGLPNSPITYEEFNIKKIAMKKPHTPKARVSILSDVLNGFIIDAQIEELGIGESKLAWKHINEASKTMPLNKTIFIFDRYYASVKLMLHILDKNGDFVFRLRSTSFKNQREKMKTDDEYILINLNNKYLKIINDKDLKQKAEEMGRLKVRIVNITLENGTVETLLTSLPPETATKKELKELYGERWEIEKDYDLLKNKFEIDNFSAKKRINIEQDFHSHIVVFNLVNEEKLVQQYYLQKNKPHIDSKKLKINNNLLIGKIKKYFLKMITTEDEKEQEKISQRITFIIQREYIKAVEKIAKTRNNNKNQNKHKITQRRNH